MTCAKCGSRGFFADAEDGLVCWACRKPYSAPWPPSGPEPEPPGKSKLEQFTWADRRRAVARSHYIGIPATAQEFGVAESTIYDWRSSLKEKG